MAILRDVSPFVEAASWRWARAHPALRFWLNSTMGQSLSVEFTLPEVTFQETGPVRITYRVNGHDLAEVPYTQPGHYFFRKDVAAKWLKDQGYNEVQIDPDHVATAKADGVKLGFLLYAAGFVGPGV